MARIKHFDPKTDSWVYSDAAYGAGTAGGSAEPDLVIGLNWKNPNYRKNAYTDDKSKRYTAEDVSIESGSVAAVVEKLQQNLPVKVVLKEVNFYHETLWSRGDTEAAQVHLSHWDAFGENTYPETPLVRLCCIFYVWTCPSILHLPEGRPMVLGITLDPTTGSVASYMATVLNCGDFL